MKINELVKIAHQDAVNNGWWKDDRNPLEIAALIHSEVSEFVEDCRGNKMDVLIMENGKPVGAATELADTIIRIADYCGRMGWDLEGVIEKKLAYNRTRGYRHGGKVY